MFQAGGIKADYAHAKSEANHYAMMYANYGPVEVRIYEKRLLSADKVQPKRRRYDQYGPLSEYGIFPECDAQPPAEEIERDEALLRQALDRLEAIVERFDPYIRDNECRPMENARFTIAALRERLGEKA